MTREKSVDDEWMMREFDTPPRSLHETDLYTFNSKHPSCIVLHVRASA